MQTMTRSTIQIILGVAVTGFVAGGCGGAQSSALRHQLNPKLLAPVAPEELAEVTSAHRQVMEAELALQHTTFLLAEVDSEWKVARNDMKRARISHSSAESNRRAAERTQMKRRLDVAAAMQARASDETKLAGAKLSYLDARRAYLRVLVDFLRHDVRARRAKVELARAEVAHSEGIRPRGFDIKAYRAQFHHHKRAAEARRRVAQRKKVPADKAMRAFELMVRKHKHAAPQARPVLEPRPVPANTPEAPRKRTGVSPAPLSNDATSKTSSSGSEVSPGTPSPTPEPKAPSPARPPEVAPKTPSPTPEPKAPTPTSTPATSQHEAEPMRANFPDAGSSNFGLAIS